MSKRPRAPKYLTVFKRSTVFKRPITHPDPSQEPSQESAQTSPSNVPGASINAIAASRVSLAALAPQHPSSAADAPAITLSSRGPDTNSTSESTDAAAASNHYATMVGSTKVPDAPKSLQTAKDASAVAFEGFKTALKALKECAGVFPPLRAAVGGLLTCMEVVDQAIQNKEDFAEMDRKLQAFIIMIEQHSRGSNSSQFRHRLDNFVRAVNQQTKAIQSRASHRLIRRLAEGSRDAGYIEASFRMIANLFDSFQTDVGLSTERNTEDILSSVLLQNLRRVEAAKYDAVFPGTPECLQRGACTAGTRKDVLEGLRTWAHNTTGPKIYWMNGMAGTGKTTIAYSFCDQLHEDDMLGASFFCSRSRSDCNDVGRIFPTIAYELARSHEAIAVALLEALKRDLSASLTRQFTELILEPVRMAMERIDKTLVVVIDALDECRDDDAIENVLGILFDHARHLPLKIFITSRPEPLILETIMSWPPDLRSALHLHNINMDVVQADIRLYVEDRLSRIAAIFKYEQGWPPDHEVKILVEQANGLFIYAATSIRYIGQRNANARMRLTHMIKLHSASESTTRTRNLDNLYATILDRAYYDLEPFEEHNVRRVLGTIINVRNPLTVCGLATVLELDVEGVKTALTSLHSVISVPPTSDGIVSVFHASFPNFLTDPKRCRPDLYLDCSMSHQTLSIQCLQLMNTSLRENICHLDGRPENKTLMSDTIAQYISNGLAYACQHWASHIQTKDIDIEDIRSLLDGFLNSQLLHWLECLSLLGKLDIAIESLQKMEEHQLDLYPGMAIMISDARRFVHENFDIIKDYCLETYHSALVWIPTQSAFRDHYAPRRSCLPNIVLGLRNTFRNECEKVIYCNSPIKCMALSKDDRRIVTSHYNVIRIWNAATGELEGMLKGHSGQIASMALSSDGSRIVSGSVDTTIRIWNVMTGELERMLKGHEKSVTCVAFSSDGSRVVSGSDDNTVRIWNAVTGRLRCVLGGWGQIASVAFSSDGSQVRSCSFDATVRTWNAVTGVLEYVLHTGEEWLMSAAFSIDGIRVVSGLHDGTVRIWNPMTGNSEGVLMGHSGQVNTVAFSSDGSRVVSGSVDATVRIWNSMTGESEGVFKEHSGWVTCVAFSSNGTCVISGSNEGMVRIWNLVTSELEGISPGYSDWALGNGSRAMSRSVIQTSNSATGKSGILIQGHSSHVSCLAFSSDGRHVASGSWDGEVRIWDTVTGELKDMFMERGAKAVSSVALSIGGSVVSWLDSFDTIWICNLVTGLKHELARHPYNFMKPSIALSNDGSRVMAGSDNGLIRMWDSATRELMHVLKGHSKGVTSVAFSSDGSRVVSCDGNCPVFGSDDKTIRIWNSVTGELVSVLWGRWLAVTSVAFSRNGRHVVCTSTDFESTDFEFTDFPSIDFESSGNDTVWIWGSDSQVIIKGHSDWVHSITISSNDWSRVAFDHALQMSMRPSNIPHLILEGYRHQVQPKPDLSEILQHMPCFISHDRTWISTIEALRVCWIPPRYRDFKSIACWESKVCFGYQDGRVIILDLTPSLHAPQ